MRSRPMKLELLRYLTTEILSGQANELQSEDDLLSTDMIDSMGVMRLVAFIEAESGLKVPPEDITVENFLSVDTICDYLQRRAGARSE